MTTTHPRESLYLIEDTLQQIQESRAAAEAEGDSEALKVIDQIEREYLTKASDKVTSYVGLIHARENRIEACEAEIDRLKSIRAAASRDIERLKGNALSVMRGFDVKSLTDDRTGRGLQRRTNGGLQSLEIPEWPMDAAGNFKPVKHELGDKHRVPVKYLVVPDTEQIRDLLKVRIPCPAKCAAGRVILDDSPSHENCELGGNCPRCKGEGTIPQTIPGVKLLERGEHVRVI